MRLFSISFLSSLDKASQLRMGWSIARLRAIYNGREIRIPLLPHQHTYRTLPPRKPPSPTWRMFLASHLKQLVSTDFFVVPTANFRILFAFVGLAHHRRGVIHFNVTAHPTSEWTEQQIAEAFPWDTTPCTRVRDRKGRQQPRFVISQPQFGP